MPHKHQHDPLSIHAARSVSKRVDPSQTGAIRRRAMAEFRKRLKALAPELRDWLDAHGRDNAPTTNNAKSAMREDLEALLYSFLVDPGPKGNGRKSIRHGRLTANAAATLYPSGVTKPVDPPSFLVGPKEKTWLDPHTDKAFRDGMIKAYEQLGGEAKTGVSQYAWLERAAENKNTLRQFEKLRANVNEGLHATTNKIADRAIQAALNPPEGKTKSEIVNGLLERAQWEIDRVVNTEATRANALGVLAGMRVMDKNRVRAEVEFCTAGDDDVCPDCEEMEGYSYDLKEAEDMIPVHPNCRCTWVPAPDEPYEGDTETELD